MVINKKMEQFNEKDLQVNIEEDENVFFLKTWFGVTLFESSEIDKCINYSSTSGCAKAYGVVDSERFRY